MFLDHPPLSTWTTNHRWLPVRSKDLAMTIIESLADRIKKGAAVEVLGVQQEDAEEDWPNQTLKEGNPILHEVPLNR